MAKLIANAEQLKAALKISKAMIAEGKTKVMEAPVWVPQMILAEFARTEGKLFNDGKTIVFDKLPKELETVVQSGQFLKLKGNGPVVQLCVAKASRDYDWEITDAQGVKRTGTIKRNDSDIRCFAI